MFIKIFIVGVLNMLQCDYCWHRENKLEGNHRMKKGILKYSLTFIKHLKIHKLLSRDTILLPLVFLSKLKRESHIIRSFHGMLPFTVFFGPSGFPLPQCSVAEGCQVWLKKKFHTLGTCIP